MLGTYTGAGTTHHLHAGLTDEQARSLEGKAREFYKRALLLQHATGCTIQIAIQACQDADRGQQ
jgi:hypothetical protein